MMKSKNLTYLMTHPQILMGFMILGGVMMLLMGRQFHSWYLQATDQTYATSPQLAIGQHLIIDGTIDGSYGYGMLWLNDQQGQRYVLKSTSTTINQLTGEVQVQGVISEYVGLIPVINVYQYKSDQLPGGPSYRYDPTNGALFRPGYDVEITSSGDLVTIVDPVVHKAVIKIRSLNCTPSDSHAECALEYQDPDESFVSSNRYTFNRHGNLWYVFGDGIGYRIRASDQYYLNTMSQYFEIMSERLMADLVKGKLKTYCVGPQANVVEYVSHTIRIQNDQVFVIIRGLGSNSKLAICQLKMYVRDHVISFESITTIPLEE